MISEAMQAIVDRCAAPIPGDNPCGEPATYDPDYEEAKTEVQKLTAMSSAEDSIDWKKVVECSSRVLADKSKDLTISGYLCIGLVMTDGYSGLAAGLDIFGRLLDKYWDGLYPPLKKIKVRALAVRLIDDRIGDLIASRDPTAEDAEAIRHAGEAIEKIRKLIPEKFGAEAPSTRNLFEAIGERTEKAGPAAPPPPKPGEQVAAAPPPAAAAPAQPPTQAPESAAEAMNAIRRMVAIIREGEPTGSAAYRLLRCIKWDPLKQEPPSPEEDGKTRVPAPRAAVRTALENLVEAANWQGLLLASEAAFADASGTFWLDLQRFACTALQELGPDYDGIRKAILSETALLLQRLPNLVSLNFADSTPFADDQTGMWIESDVNRPGQDAPTAAPKRIDTGEDESLEADLKEARKKIKDKDLQGAMELLQAGIDAAPSRRRKFIRKLAAAKLCLKAGRPAWAVALLEGLDQETDRLTLEQWEPQLCADVWETLYLCYRKLLASKKVEMAETLMERSVRARDKLLRIDLRSAAALDSRKS